MNLLKSLISVSFMTLISRVLGFIRDVLIASIFGASAFTDAFFVAFKIPNLLRRIFSEGAFLQSFIPILMEYKADKNQKYVQYFIYTVFIFMFIILFISVILGIFFSHSLILITAPGFARFPNKLNLSTSLLKIMFPYILLISLSSLLSSILNSWNYFFISSFPPIFLNVSIIIISFYFSSSFHPSIFSLAWAVIIGGFFQLFYHFPFLYKMNMLIPLNIKWDYIGLLRVLKKMGPAILGAFSSQISLVINTSFSSLLAPGSISWMYYADRLIEFPIGILGVSMSTILFTSLSKSYKYGLESEYKKLLSWGLKISLVLSLPGTCIIFILSKPIIMILFQYGKCTDFDVAMIQKSLEFYSFGLISFILVKILASAFHAYEEMNIPMQISILTLFLTQIMNPFFIFYFQHAGLALSISISGWINFLLLYWKLYKKNIVVFTYKDFIFIIHLLLSTFIMILILSFMLYFMPSWHFGSLFSKIFRLFCLLLVSGVGYLSVLSFFKINFFSLSRKISKIQ